MSQLVNGLLWAPMIYRTIMKPLRFDTQVDMGFLLSVKPIFGFAYCLTLSTRLYPAYFLRDKKHINDNQTSMKESLDYFWDHLHNEDAVKEYALKIHKILEKRYCDTEETEYQEVIDAEFFETNFACSFSYAAQYCVDNNPKEALYGVEGITNAFWQFCLNYDLIEINDENFFVDFANVSFVQQELKRQKRDREEILAIDYLTQKYVKILQKRTWLESYDIAKLFRVPQYHV